MSCTVALTFDFDAESGWLGGMKVDTPGALSRGAYGAYEGVPRVLALLERRGLPATFFVPGDTADRHPEVVDRIVAAGHEVGHHGYLHESPHLLTAAEERRAMERGLEALRRRGVVPTGYRSPSLEVSVATYDLLTEYGFSYDSSQFARDRPYWVEIGGRQTDIVEVPSAWELTDTAHFFFAYEPYRMGLSGPSKVEEIWREDFDGAREEDHRGCYVLSLHPELIGRHHRMQMLERLVTHMQHADHVRFAPLGEIADTFRRQRARLAESPVTIGKERRS